MEGVVRPSGRAAEQIRKVKITKNFTCYAEGSVLIEMGNTKVICTASVENKVPGWMKEENRGWVTAEYGMLPRATGTRTDREAVKGKQSGRTQEIQRLIGRSLRAVVDMEILGPRTIKAQVAAISVGVYNGLPVCDLDYEEDHLCDTDMNVVMTSENKFVEVQGTAEGDPFDEETLNCLIKLAKNGISELMRIQNQE